MQKIPQPEWKKFQSNFCQTWTWKIIKLNWIWVWIWIINTEPRSEMCWRFCKIFCESLPISINPCYQCWSSELSFNPQLSCLWLMEEDCAVWLTDMWPMVGPTADWGESSRKSPLYRAATLVSSAHLSQLQQRRIRTCNMSHHVWYSGKLYQLLLIKPSLILRDCSILRIFRVH